MRKGPTGNPGAALNWADVLFESGISDAIYSVGVTLTAGSKRYNYVLGSAFAAHYINGVWTNAHVAIRVRDEADQVPEWADTVTPFVAKSGTFIGGVNTHRPTRYDVHPYYDGSTASPDVAFILIDDDLPNLAEILPRRFVTRLQVGQPIATIGFPGETTSAYTRYARATFKDGTISALQPYLLSTQESPEKNRILQHNLDTTGGTSGSAIFDSSGWVVAVNHAAAGKWVMGEDGDPVIIRDRSHRIRHQNRRSVDHDRHFRAAALRDRKPRNTISAGQKPAPPNQLPSLPKELERRDNKSTGYPPYGPDPECRSALRWPACSWSGRTCEVQATLGAPAHFLPWSSPRPGGRVYRHRNHFLDLHVSQHRVGGPTTCQSVFAGWPTLLLLTSLRPSAELPGCLLWCPTFRLPRQESRPPLLAIREHWQAGLKSMASVPSVRL